MDSKEDLSYNPWARYLGIDSIDYSEITETTVKPKSTVTKLNYEDMSLFGLCPVYEDLHLTICKICESILMPQALKAHMELRHGAKVKKKPDEKLSSEPLGTKPKAIPPAACSTSAASSSLAAACASSECSNAYSASSSSSVRSPDSPAVGSFLPQSSVETKPPWLFRASSVHGATTLQQSFLNTNASANIVRVKPEHSKMKVLTTPYCRVESSDSNSSAKNVAPKKTVSHKKELVSSSQQPGLVFPESSSNFPSLSNVSSTSSKMSLDDVTCSSEVKSEPASLYSPVPQPSQLGSPSSSESSSTTDNSECSQTGKKAPALEKLVLRRVLQTGPNSSAVRRPTFQKGTKGISRNKKDSQETYFMVVKQKDRQQNLMAARQQLRKQSNVVHKEKDKIEQKLSQLESVRDKLITQLFQELHAIKQKLLQCNDSKSELTKELMTVRQQLEEARRMNEIQTETLSKQNSDYKKEIQDLKEKIDLLTASTSSFLEQQQMANQACKVRQYAHVIAELKRRLDAQITQNQELMTQKDMLEKHLPPEIRFTVKSQIANYQVQQEIYPGLNMTESSIPSPAVPFAEKYLSDLRNIEYCAFQHQMAND